MYHGIDRVNALEVPTNQNIRLNLLREDGDDLGKATFAGPIVGERMF